MTHEEYIYSSVVLHVGDDLMKVGHIVELSPINKIFKCIKIEELETLDKRYHQYILKSNIYSDDYIYVRQLSKNFIIVFNMYTIFDFEVIDEYTIKTNNEILKSKLSNDKFYDVDIDKISFLRQKYINEKFSLEIYKNYDTNEIKYLFGKICSMDCLKVY